MSFAAFSKALDGDMYQAGAQWKDTDGCGCQALQFMASHAKNEGFFPDDKTLDRLTNNLIVKHHIPEWAEDRRFRMREFAAQKWVFDNYMKQYGVVTEGPQADYVKKAFSVVPAELTVFPFFWDTIIIEQILAVPLLDILVADTVTVNSGTAVHAQMNETLEDKTIGETGEFSSFHEVNVSSTEFSVKLRKFGAQVSVSDEAMRRQRIPVFARGFARYGRQIGIDMTDFGLEELLTGAATQAAGNVAIGACPTAGAAAAPGAPVYSDYVNLFMNFDIGYEPTDLVLTRNSIVKLLSIVEFKDPLAGFKFQSTAIMPEVFGLMPHRWDATRSSTWNATGVTGQGGTALALQRGRALIMYQEGGLATESDRDPRTQTTIVTTSWYLAFAVADRRAARTMTGVSLPA